MVLYGLFFGAGVAALALAMAEALDRWIRNR